MGLLLKPGTGRDRDGTSRPVLDTKIQDVNSQWIEKNEL